jgi:hypothetical protein
MRLSRTRQCDKCPWKVSTDPHDIPHGYSEDKHRALKATIAEPGSLNLGAPLMVMACHEHPQSKEVYCLGWLMNQLGPGNNIALRLALSDRENLAEVKLIGKQHKRFEDTLPKPPLSPEKHPRPMKPS